MGKAEAIILTAYGTKSVKITPHVSFKGGTRGEIRFFKKQRQRGSPLGCQRHNLPEAKNTGVYMHTFYLEPALWQEPYILEGSEAHHARRVLRLGVGERVILIDGAGRRGEFVLTKITRQRLNLEPQSIETVPPPVRSIVLAVGFPKDLRRFWLFEKVVELGGHELWFWQAKRSQGRVPKEPKQAWTSRMIAGAKQSSQGYIPKIRVFPGGAGELCAAMAGFSKIFLLHEDRQYTTMLTPEHIAGRGRILCILGPEGGIGPEETEMFVHAGCVPVSLGPAFLRYETAALLTLGLFWWGANNAS